MFFFDLEPGGSVLAYRRIDADNDTVLSTDYVLSVNNGASDWTLFLPDPTTMPIGKTYIVKRYSTSSTGDVSIDTTSGSISLGAYPTGTMFINDGTFWEFIT